MANTPIVPERRCPHGIPRVSVSEGCVECPCPALGDGETHPHQWDPDEPEWCRQCGVTRNHPHQRTPPMPTDTTKQLIEAARDLVDFVYKGVLTDDSVDFVAKLRTALAAIESAPIQSGSAEEVARLAIVHGSSRCDAYEKAGKCRDLCKRECVGELDAIAQALVAFRAAGVRDTDTFVLEQAHNAERSASNDDLDASTRNWYDGRAQQCRKILEFVRALSPTPGDKP